MNNKIKFYCYFLPQFHECPFNNLWWGQGFTEWENVRKSKPLFKDHLQPRIPTRGYFSLAEQEELEFQFNEAQLHGIDGFVFYHYWYEGKRPLAKPMNLILSNKNINIKFSLCWANHSWTRSWKNRAGSMDVLIEQTYEKTYEKRCIHYNFLHESFLDKRYICVDERPLFQIYVPRDIPNLPRFVNELREFCLKKSNLKIHISALINIWSPNWNYLKYFDSATLHQPTLGLYSPNNIFSPIPIRKFNSDYFTAGVRALPKSLKRILYIVADKLFNKVSFFNYDETWEKILKQTENALNQDMLIFPSAFVDFDNTPRYKQRAKIVKGFTPEKFGYYLRKLAMLNNSADSKNIIFINAWNEWGEGMYLQSDNYYGNSKLMQIKNIKQDILI